MLYNADEIPSHDTLLSIPLNYQAPQQAELKVYNTTQHKARGSLKICAIASKLEVTNEQSYNATKATAWMLDQQLTQHSAKTLGSKIFKTWVKESCSQTQPLCNGFSWPHVQIKTVTVNTRVRETQIQTTPRY